MERIYLVENYRAWGELPEGDYDRTSFEENNRYLISRDVSINGLVKVVNDEEELNILIQFLGLKNFEEIMDWIGTNSISTKQMLAILQLDVINRADIEEIIFINDFPEYAQEKYFAAKRTWKNSFEMAITRIMKNEGIKKPFVEYISEGAFENVDAKFWKVVDEMAEIYRKENNAYYRSEEVKTFYGILQIADEYMTRDTKRGLVGDKFDKFISWAAMAAANEVEDEFIYEEKGTFDEKRHFNRVSIRNMLLGPDGIFSI